MGGTPIRVALGAVVFAGSAGAASARELMSSPLSMTGSSAGACTSGELGGRGVQRRTVTAPASGWVKARLYASRGDWDLSVFDRGTGRRVAGSSGFGADEVAEGLVAAGQRLSVQACRLRGAGRRADLTVDFQALGKAKQEKASLVHVSTPTRRRKDELTSLDLDLTEHGRKGFVAVVLHGAKDAELLRRHGFSYTTEVRDLAKYDARTEASTRRYSRGVQASALPTRRTSYRQLSDYTDDLKRLVRENPGLVRPVTLPYKTWEGRSVEGVEITTNVNHINDGKPIFMNMGLHHAREWPSGEHAIEWAFELVNGYRARNPRVRNIVSRIRTVVVPVVNPDGFNISRVAGTAAPNQGGRGNPNPGESNETANIVAHPYEYRRKNCRLPEGEGGTCAQPALGLAALGVDPNRNYGTFWGGGGASGDPTNETYYGPGPFSEPETRNIKEFVSRRQVTVLITNHTYSDLILRPPGIAAQGNPPDEAQLKALGDAMARENGYFSQHGFDLYDTTGTTEDWSYNSTGGYGYTFEIGCEVPNTATQDCTSSHFHPPYQKVVAEYEGTTPMSNRFKNGRGNREAYFLASETAANAGHHSLVAGRGPHGLLLRVRKQFNTPTSVDNNGDRRTDTFRDSLHTLYEIPASGNTAFHLNPSTRPLVSKNRGRRARGPASGPVTSSGNPAPAGACPGWHEGVVLPNCYRDHPFQIPGAPSDNAFVTVNVNWNTIASDYLIEVYRDTNGNGVVNSGEPLVDEQDSSGQSDFEQLTLGPDPRPGRYILRVGNFAASEPYNTRISFQGPTFVQGRVESWDMTCETFGGVVLDRTALTVARGQRTSSGLRACSAALRRALRTCRHGDRPTRRVRGRVLDRARLGRDRRRHLRTFKIGRKGRRNVDRFCLRERGRSRLLSIGYPSSRTTRGFKRSYRRRVRNKAVFILTSARSFRIRKVRAGMRIRSRRVRRRIGKVRRYRVGRNVWYVRKGSRARLIYKTRRGRITAVGIADKRLTATKRRTRRFLKSFR